MKLASLALDRHKISASHVTSPCFSSPTNVAISPVRTVNTSTLSSAAKCVAISSSTLSPAARPKPSFAQPLSNSRMVCAESAAKSKGTTSLLRRTPVLKFVVMESCSITSAMMVISWMETGVRRIASSRKDGAARPTLLDRHQCANWKRHYR